jgi:hypothetical protein
MNIPNIPEDINLKDLQNIFQNVDSSIQSNIGSKIKSGIDEISTAIADSIETTLTPAITDAVTEAIKPEGGVLDEVQNTYEYYKFYVDLIFYLIFSLLILCIISMGTNLYANYMYITTPTKVDIPDEYDNALESIYDYSMTTELKNMIYKMNNNLMSEGIQSAAILDIEIISENKSDKPVSLFKNMIKSSQLQSQIQSPASVLSIDRLMKENNSNKISIDIFIDHADYNTLHKYLINNSYDRLSIVNKVENIYIKFKFKIYKKKNGSYHLVNNSNVQDIKNYHDIYPLNSVKLIGSNKTIHVLNKCY